MTHMAMKKVGSFLNFLFFCRNYRQEYNLSEGINGAVGEYREG